MNITPGPYHIGGRGNSTAKIDHNEIRVWGPDKTCVATVSLRRPLGEGPSKEEFANARAIAEVPNLIEAIREFIDLCPRMSESDPIASALANQCQYAKLILKRIEG